jgi:hypothetical protein
MAAHDRQRAIEAMREMKKNRAPAPNSKNKKPPKPGP